MWRCCEDKKRIKESRTCYTENNCGHSKEEIKEGSVNVHNYEMEDTIMWRKQEKKEFIHWMTKKLIKDKKVEDVGNNNPVNKEGKKS